MSMSQILARPAVALLTLISIAVAARADAPVEKRYLRYVEDGKPRLETSIVHLDNGKGVTVDLIGAVHIADASYYDKLNERFKTYDAVLYEMVKPKDMVNMAERGGSDSWVSMLQKFMKSNLDLAFQLDKVDYTPANFVHADLDAETFAKKQEEAGESMLTLMVNSMLREMSKSQEQQEQTQASIFDLIAALQAPDSAKQLKLILAKQFESMDEAMDAMGGADSVIIGERNKQALKVMKEQMDAGKKHMAIFYGAGHLHGMEELMNDLMGFKTVGEPEWLTAWDLQEQVPAPRRPAPPATAPAAEPVHP